MLQQLLKMPFPQGNRFAHFGQVRIADVDLGNGAHRAFRFVGNHAHPVIEQALNDVRRNTELGKSGAEGSSQIMQDSNYSRRTLCRRRPSPWSSH